jgi:hypothetical protein
MIHMRIRAHAAAAAALLSPALPAAAQDAAPAADSIVAVIDDTVPRTSLQKGTWSLSFVPPGYSGSGERTEFGAWEMVGPRTNLGITLAVAVDGSESDGGGGGGTDATTLVSLGASVKQYVMAPRDVTPFLLGGIAIGGVFTRRDRSDGFEESSRGMNGNVRAAVGAEWFPVRRMSLSGFTGFSLNVTRADIDQTWPDETEIEGEASYFSFRSFTSALWLQIYF